MIHKFKVEPTENGGLATYIDDKKVKLCAVDVRLRINEVPTVKIELAAMPDLECECILDLTDDEIFYMVKDKMDKNPEFRMKIFHEIKELQQRDDAKIIASFRKAGWEL